MKRPRTGIGQLTESLLVRIAVALVLVGLVPLAFVAERLINLKRDALVEQVEQTHTIAARTAAERMGAFLESRMAFAQSIAASPSLMDPSSDSAKRALRESLSAWAPLGVVGLVVVDPQGREVLRAQLADDLARMAVEDALLDPFGRSVGVLEGSSSRTLRFVVSLPGEAGTVWLLSRSDELDNILETYELGEDATLALVDQDRNILAGNAASHRWFPEEMLELSLTNRLSGVKPSFRSEEGDQTFIGAFASVPLAQWAVLSRQPTSVAQRVEESMRQQEILILAVTVLLVGSMAGLAYRNVVLRLRRVVKEQRRLFGLDTSDSGDVLADLEKTFAAMARNLDDKVAVDEVFLGRYQVTGMIGRGSMGTVFRGWDPKLQRDVALKTVRIGADFTKKEQMLESLMREAVTAAAFRHPNIVAVYDVEDRPEAAYVAMEFIQGTSLARLLWRRGLCTVPESLAIAGAVAEALAYAHREGVAHRDIKPGNVLLGEDDSIKVTDFGIAEMMESGTERDVVFGTPGYLAPEALSGKAAGARGDVFALGAVMYCCLTGFQPFRGKTLKETIELTMFGDPTPPHEADPLIPESVSRVVLTLVDKDPLRRPVDGDAALELLRPLMAEHEAQWRYPIATSHDGDDDSGPLDSEPSVWVPTRRLPSSSIPPLPDEGTRQVEKSG